MRKQNLKIDEFVEMTISSRKTNKNRRIDELIEKLASTDSLIVTELSQLGHSTAEILGLINALIQRNIRIRIIKQEMDIQQLAKCRLYL